MAKVSFQYDVIADKNIRKQVEGHAKEIRGHLERTGKSVVEIGRRMQLVYDALSPAMFRAWLECECGWNRSTASNYMQAARVFGDCDCLGQIQPAAIVALSRQNVPESVTAAALELARNGEVINHRRAQALLAEAGVQPVHKSAGVARKPHTAAVAAAMATFTADSVQALQQSLDAFAANVDLLASQLDEGDRLALADRFLSLAVQIRQPQPTASRPGKTARKAAAAMATA